MQPSENTPKVAETTEYVLSDTERALLQAIHAEQLEKETQARAVIQQAAERAEEQMRGMLRLIASQQKLPGAGWHLSEDRTKLVR